MIGNIQLDYAKKNDLLYPKVQISDNPEADTTPLGKYGQMCLKFLQEEQPDRYKLLLMNGELVTLMHKINEEAHQKITELTNELMTQYNDGDADTMVDIRRRNAANDVAEEVVIREFVLIPR